jgi:CDP-diacylglycerol---serine O-phosphatidyltransferase
MPPREIEFDGVDPIERIEPLHRSASKLRLRRGIHLLPCIFTVANLMCGYYVIRVAVDGNALDFDNAALALWLAWIFDALDGAVARAMGTNSAFGKEFDSLADIVTFGIAPMILAYVWALRVIVLPGSEETAHLIQLGWLIGLFYVVCCAWRLARFNLQVTKPGENRYFAGMPAPAGALMVAALVHFDDRPIQYVRWSLLFLLLLVVLGILMLSTVRHYSFKNIHWARRRPSITVILVTLFLAAIIYFSRISLLVLAGTYVAHGITLQFIRTVRHRMGSRHP